MRRLAVLTVLSAAVFAVPAGPAAAGGPTSVLLVAPDTGQTAALHVNHSSYPVLSKLVDVSPASLVDRGGSAERHASGPVIRMTWLIHDVQVWRIDEVYVAAAGGPWIATRQSWEGDPLGIEPTWHRSPEPDRLTQLLRQLKVLDSNAPVETVEPAPVPSGMDPPAQADGPPTAVESLDPVALSGWRWILPGLLAGAALTYLAVRLSPSWQRRDRGPRWELIDESEDPAELSTSTRT
jgi:hypothetical protein